MITGHISEEHLALYLTGDVAVADSRAIRAHVEECAACRETVEEFERTRELLRGAWEEIAEEDLQDVRAGVMARVRGQAAASSWRMWCAGAAAACLALFCGLYLGTRQPEEHGLVQPNESALAIVPPNQPKLLLPPVERVARARTGHHRAAAGMRSVALIAQASGPPVIRLSTADPNVVIFLTPEERSEANE